MANVKSNGFKCFLIRRFCFRYFLVFVAVLGLGFIIPDHYYSYIIDKSSEFGSIILSPPDKPPFSYFTFIILATVAFTVPGIPGSALTFCCGRFYGLKFGLIAAIFCNQLGASISFLSSRFLCSRRMTKISRGLGKRDFVIDITVLQKAVELEAWRITFLARFIFIPVQLKNILFGILPVPFRIFFICTLVGDAQSAFVGVYLGMLSVQAQKSDAHERQKRILLFIGGVLAIVFSIAAARIARNAYLRAIPKHIDADDVEANLNNINEENISEISPFMVEQ